MAPIRSKMKLVEITSLAYSAQSKRLKFHSEYDPTIPEDQRFQMATPSAAAEYHVDNPEALKQFELGKTYYVDFIPVDPVLAGAGTEGPAIS